MTGLAWDDDLLWCPSQCYADVTYPDGTPAVLYLRWRHDDPWTAHVVKGVRIGQHLPGGDWSAIPVPYFTADQLAELKAWVEAWWEADAAYLADEVQP